MSLKLSSTTAGAANYSAIAKSDSQTLWINKTDTVEHIIFLYFITTRSHLVEYMA